MGRGTVQLPGSPFQPQAETLKEAFSVVEPPPGGDGGQGQLDWRDYGPQNQRPGCRTYGSGRAVGRGTPGGARPAQARNGTRSRPHHPNPQGSRHGSALAEMQDGQAQSGPAAAL